MGHWKGLGFSYKRGKNHWMVLGRGRGNMVQLMIWRVLR